MRDSSGEGTKRAGSGERRLAGFFERARARWEALIGSHAQRPARDDTQLINQGAREHYAPDIDEDRIESLTGPRAEGSYVFPVIDPLPRRESIEHKSLREPGELFETARLRYDPRYESSPGRWHRDRVAQGWSPIETGDRGGVLRGDSPDDGWQQWSHPIQRDPRSDRTYRERDYETPLSRASTGDRVRRGASDSHPSSSVPPRGRRWQQR